MSEFDDEMEKSVILTELDPKFEFKETLQTDANGFRNPEIPLRYQLIDISGTSIIEIVKGRLNFPPNKVCCVDFLHSNKFEIVPTFTNRSLTITCRDLPGKIFFQLLYEHGITDRVKFRTDFKSIKTQYNIESGLLSIRQRFDLGRM